MALLHDFFSETSDLTFPQLPAANDSFCLTFRQKLKRLIHFGPFATLFIILFVSFLTLWCCVRPDGAFDPLSNFLLFCFVSLLLYPILVFYFSACFSGPGYVPYSWRPPDPSTEHSLQFCEICQGFKPPRTHHCRSCQRCVMKMDHHCPWINSCCGHFNHGYFFMFVLAAPTGCLLCSIILAITCYWDFTRLPMALFGSNANTGWVILLLTAEMFALGLATGVTIAVAILLYSQAGGILRNETGIESWIIEKANRWRLEIGKEPFENPYDLGRWENFRQVVSWSGTVSGDGITWPVRDGCGEFNFTLEQIRQKQLKQAHSQRCHVARAYSAGWCWSTYRQFGCRTCLDSPACQGEPYLKLEPGDQVLVTNWKRHWLYGQLIDRDVDNDGGGGGQGSMQTNVDSFRQPRRTTKKGWFPRLCLFNKAGVPPHEEPSSPFNEAITNGTFSAGRKKHD